MESIYRKLEEPSYVNNKPKNLLTMNDEELKAELRD